MAESGPPVRFPVHRASVVPKGMRFEIWLDGITCLSHVINDADFLMLFKTLRDQRKVEAAQKIEIAHVMLRGKLN